MNIELLGRNAINKIKETWKLPKKGFLAGGSISNLIWEEISGNKSIINDIDIFILDEILELQPQVRNKELYSFSEKDVVWLEDGYQGINFIQRNKDHYTIKESTQDGIFNYVKYSSNVTDPGIIIRSFDINCTAIGYSIDEDKFYWTKDFEDFLSNGNLKVTNLRTPCHTAIRIVKKQDELNAILDDFELKILQYTMIRGSSIETYKINFQERYLNLFAKYIDKLSEFFYIKKDLDLMGYVKYTHNKDVKLWKLLPSNDVFKSRENFDLENLITNGGIETKPYIDANMGNLKSFDILFYMRNIYGNKELSDIWTKLHYFYNNNTDYVDKDVDVEDIKLLGKLVKYAPSCIENIKGLKLSEQVTLVKRLLSKYEDDPTIAISILEKHKIDKDILLDIDNILLLELSVRKEIVNFPTSKLNNILEDILI
jgi:hypothetical protein